MSNYYVDSNSGDNGDNGTTQALAWATIEYAVESGGLSAGDKVYPRRTHVEYSGAPTSNIVEAYSGDRDNPISIIGWPRAAIPNTTITSASWTNGSTTVDLVVGVSLSREAHCGRWATAPNGKKFLITRIIDSNTLIIDREYSGATVTSTNGKFQIEADEDYSDRPADVDDWDSDADDLPLVDFQGAAYYYNFSAANFTILKNIEFKNSGTFVIVSMSDGGMVGCLFSTTYNEALVYPNYSFMDRCIITGSGSGGSQIGISGIAMHLLNSAIYNCGGAGVQAGSALLENVNIGVEQVNAGADIELLNNQAVTRGKDVKLGSTTKFSCSFLPSLLPHTLRASFENYQKVLGDHKTFFGVQTLTSKDVVAGSGDPYKRSGGADKIIEIDCSDSATYGASIPERAIVVFEHEFETGVSSKSYRYYVQCKALSLTAAELWLEVEYVDSYDDTTKYTITKEVSDETCSLRSDAEDWTQYIEVTGIAPAVASKVRIRCFVAKYDADGLIFIDPQAVVS